LIQSLAFWRGLAGALAVLAVLAVALPLYRTPGSSPTTAQSGAPYIATIEEDKTHRPVALMIMPAEGDEVVLQLVDAQGPVPSDHVLQLWMANPSGPGVVSAGLAPQGAGAEPVRFKVPDPARLRASPVVALSLEPAGGSPSATHVLGLGKWSKPAT
jgi:anti-sigma-K factor RskA